MVYKKNELQFLEKDEVHNFEPNVKCLAGIYCSKDGSIDYGSVARELLKDAKRFGCKIVTGSKVVRIVRRNGNRPHAEDNDNDGGDSVLYTNNGKKFISKYVINTACGNAVDIAHSMGVASEYTDLFIRTINTEISQTN